MVTMRPAGLLAFQRLSQRHKRLLRAGNIARLQRVLQSLEIRADLAALAALARGGSTGRILQDLLQRGEGLLHVGHISRAERGGERLEGLDKRIRGGGLVKGVRPRAGYG